MMRESDPFETLLDTVLQVIRDGYLPAPKLIVKLRAFNGEFARLCAQQGYSFDDNGVLIQPQETPPCA